MGSAFRLPRLAPPSTGKRPDMRETGIANVYLKAGEFFMSNDPARVITVLGSCVAVTMFSSRLGTGAICHALLPCRTGPGEDFKYVDSSIGQMVKAFERLKAARQEIEVKLFGGSDMFNGQESCSFYVSIGQQNIKAAIRTIEDERLKLVASDVGGNSGRKLYYFPHTNAVFIKRLKK